MVVFLNFIRQPLPHGSKTGAGHGGQPGALGMGQQTSTGLVSLVMLWGSVMQLLGAFIAYRRWGRYKTIQWANAIDFLSHATLIIAAVRSVTTHSDKAIVPLNFWSANHGNRLRMLQVDDDTKLTVDKDGNHMIVDRETTRSRIFIYFCSVQNAGSIDGAICMVTRWLATGKSDMAVYIVDKRQVVVETGTSAATPTLNDITNDLIGNLKPIFPYPSRTAPRPLIYPTIDRPGLKSTPISNTSIGFFFAAFTIAVSAIIQHFVHEASYCGSYASQCTQNGHQPHLSAWIQILPQFTLAISKILTGAPGLDFA
ncbi:hypothetical protein K469DRAFT_754840 [Zopfia rhizophila CBS 207.26]|uniref:Uncharacterized protein n=1 Tax=Zopfia rhizophila CBS 207.26 TaxID=1314779 RepID=A0A6A6DFF3_9PEZI|nr:hypothetical protein K469DRAFT_754840 [Zopfia rhizophila CBS 207.26]